MVSLAESLITALQQPGQERLRDLVRNPLCLTLLCHVWDGSGLPGTQDDDSGLPDTQAKLYKQYLDKFHSWNKNLQELENYAERCKADINRLKALLHNQLGEFEADVTIIEALLHQQLGELAIEALNTPQEGFRLSQSLVEKYLGKSNAKKSLCHLALQLGLLNRTNIYRRGNNTFAFYHATFQEYFAALAIPDWNYFLPKEHKDQPIPDKAYRIFDPQWKQVILVWLGRRDITDEEKEEFIRALVDFEGGCDDFYDHQAYFLAAVGINEFKKSPLSSEIVRQIVQWGFGYFDEEEKQWIAFLEIIEEGARNIIPETIRKLAIAELIKTSEHCKNKHISVDITGSLSKIDPRNSKSITYLIHILKNNQDKSIREKVIIILGEIGQANSEAILALISILETSENIDIRGLAAESLGKISFGNPTTITSLVSILKTVKNEDIRLDAAKILGKIDPGNREAVYVLVHILNVTEDKETCCLIAKELDEIDPRNPKAIIALISILDNTEDENIRHLAAKNLGQIDPRNPRAIDVLEELITSQNEYIQREAAKSLGEIGGNISVAINALVKLICTSQDEQTQLHAAVDLGEIGENNLIAITALEKLMNTSQDEFTQCFVAGSLEKLDKNNPIAVSALVRLIHTSKHKHIPWTAMMILRDISTGHQQMLGVVTSVRDCLSNKIYEDYFKEYCYTVFWGFAANLPYPQFYQAWHHPPTTPHPEVVDQTPVGHNSTVASLETQKIDICRELQNLPIFCLKAHILAAETRESEITATLCQLIWDKALPDADYPEAITTPSQLRNHLKQLQRNQKLPKLAILLTDCENPTPALITFCHKLTNILSIAWLTDQPLEAPLKGFPPDQPNLLSAIETWLEET